MAIAMKLKDYLDHEDIAYDLVTHPYSSTCMQAAEESHIPGDKIAKGVLLYDSAGYILAVVPATHKVKLGKLRKSYNRYLSLADENALHNIFDDCSVGAVPPVGKAYEMAVIVDDALNKHDDVYFEAGDHTSLVHMKCDDFRNVLHDVPHGEFSKHI